MGNKLKHLPVSGCHSPSPSPAHEPGEQEKRQTGHQRRPQLTQRKKKQRRKRYRTQTPAGVELLIAFRGSQSPGVLGMGQLQLQSHLPSILFRGTFRQNHFSGCLALFLSFFLNIIQLWGVSFQPAFHFEIVFVSPGIGVEQRRILTARQGSASSRTREQPQHIVHHTTKLQLFTSSGSSAPVSCPGNAFSR